MLVTYWCYQDDFQSTVNYQRLSYGEGKSSMCTDLYVGVSAHGHHTLFKGHVYARPCHVSETQACVPLQPSKAQSRGQHKHLPQRPSGEQRVRGGGTLNMPIQRPQGLDQRRMKSRGEEAAGVGSPLQGGRHPVSAAV